jgi:hypothetical protein
VIANDGFRELMNEPTSLVAAQKSCGVHGRKDGMRNKTGASNLQLAHLERPLAAKKE